MEFSITSESCRVCLQKTSTGKHLSEPARGRDHMNKRTLLDWFHLCTGFTDPPWLQLETHTFFPRKICAVCEQLLRAAHEFRKRSTKSEKVLQNILHFCDDDEACSVLEETVQRNQGQEDFVADIKLEEGSTDQQETEIVEDGEGEFKLEAETHHDGSADQHGTAPVVETGLVLLQEAAVLVADESQTNLLVIEEPCDLVQEEGYEKQTTNEISECWETIEHPYDISTHDAYPDEEIVLEEYTEVAAGIDTYDEFESMVDEDEEETDSGMTGNYIDCPDCGKLVTVRYLPKHRETHTSTQRYECPVCQLRFTFAENLAKHKRIHQNDKRYACPYCQKLFLHWASRRYHIERVHTKEKRFACEYCGARFRQSSHYQVHLRRHTGSKPYACSLCSNSFVSKSSLKAHMLSHSDRKEFQCNLCYKLYKSAKSLRIHLRTHSNAKEYVCSVCEKTFAQNHSLRTHHMHAHPEFELPPAGTIANIKAINRLKNDETNDGQRVVS
uniref:Protein krueppel n=1 Tax=Anopheles atroparvus TaxID=41427 RepID=A0AAG5D9I3_ANOAO